MEVSLAGWRGSREVQNRCDLGATYFHEGVVFRHPPDAERPSLYSTAEISVSRAHHDRCRKRREIVCSEGYEEFNREHLRCVAINTNPHHNRQLFQGSARLQYCRRRRRRNHNRVAANITSADQQILDYATPIAEWHISVHEGRGDSSIPMTQCRDPFAQRGGCHWRAPEIDDLHQSGLPCMCRPGIGSWFLLSTQRTTPSSLGQTH